MAKTEKDAVTGKAKSKINDLLGEIEAAYDAHEAAKEVFGQVSAETTTAVSKAQFAFESVKKDAAKKLAEAEADVKAKSEALVTLQQAFTARVGSVTGQSSDPFVSVK